MASSELQPMSIYHFALEQGVIIARDDSLSPGWSAFGGETLSPYDLKVVVQIPSNNLG